MAMTQQQQAQAAAQANTIARSLITSRAIKMTQTIYTNTINPTTQQVVQIPIRNVGLVLGWWVEINISTADPGAGSNFALTPFGPANILQQIVLTDLNNNVRIQTSGWHLHFVNSAKKRRPFFAANTLTTYPIAYGNNWATVFSAAGITGGGAHPNLFMRYWVPAAYSDYDLRGAMYMNVVNATAYLQLQLTASAQAFVAAGADPTLAVYQQTLGAAAGAWGTTCAITVRQVYYDQLPVSGNNVVLPFTDLSAIYEIKNVAYTGMVTGQDFPVPYSNFRDFLSTFVVWDNGGTLDVGANTNYWALQSANFTNIFNVSANFQAGQARNEIGDDFPTGVYYFPTRDKPISTIQYGNMNLILNPTGVIAAGAQLLVGYEDFALVNTLVGAASIQTTA
jgi:hypothetical protein